VNSLVVFAYQNQEVRTYQDKNGNIWFVAKDVCDVLAISNSRDAISRLDDDERGVATTDTLGGNQEMVIVSESGLYSLVLTSRKKEAKIFKKWITSEVLPSIRKTGSYSIAHRIPQTFADALRLAADLQEEKDRLEIENKMLLEENEHLSETVDELFSYSSIVRVAKYNRCSEKSFNWRRLKATSIQMRLEIKQVPDPNFGTKNLYSHDVWRVAYPGIALPETTTIRIAS
jgi:prophage antirepressor-like protein